MENDLHCSLEIETASWQIGENGHSKYNETQWDQNAQWENQAAYALNGTQLVKERDVDGGRVGPWSYK